MGQAFRVHLANHEEASGEEVTTQEELWDNACDEIEKHYPKVDQRETAWDHAKKDVNDQKLSNNAGDETEESYQETNEVKDSRDCQR